MKKEYKNIVDLQEKKAEELLEAFGAISEDILFLQRCLATYPNKEEALKQYEKGKVKRKHLAKKYD